MFLNNAIHQYLNKHIDAYTLKKGAELVRNKFVKDPQRNAFEKFISVVVKEINQVKVYYDNAFTISAIQCGCRQQINCEHISAALYYLLSLNDNQLVVVENNVKKGERPSGTGVGMNNGELQPPQHSGTRSLELKPANQYRLLPANSQEELNKILPYLKSMTGQNISFYMRYMLVLNDDDTLMFCMVSQYDITYRNIRLPDMINGDEYYKVYFKYEKNRIYFKCSHCKKNDGKLCDHQYFALNENQFINTLFSKAWTHREQLVQKLSKELGVSENKFDKLYKIAFEKNVPVPALVAQNYMTVKELQKEKKAVHNFFISNRSSSDIFAEHLMQKSKAQKANALLWVMEFSENELPVILEGILPKAGGKLSTQITPVSRPVYFSDEQEDFHQQMLALYNEYGKSNNKGFNKYMLQFLKSHIDVLKKTINYCTFEYTENDKLAKKDLELITFSDELADILFDTEEDDDFYAVKIYLRIGDNLIAFNSPEYEIYPYFVVSENKAYFYKSSDVSNYFNLKEITDSFITDKDDPKALVELLNEFAKSFDVNYPAHIQPEVRKVENTSKALFLKDGGNYVVLEPRIILDDGQFITLPFTGKFVTESENDINPVFIEVPEELESSFLEFLSDQHPSFAESYKKTGNFYIEVKDLIRNAWFLDFFAVCKNEDIQIYGHEKLNNFRFNTNSAKISMNICSGIDWFDVKVDISFGDQKVQLKQWVESVRNNERYVLLDDGSLGLIPDEWYEKLKQVALASDEEKGKLKISKFRFGIIDEMFEELADDKMMNEIRVKMKQLQRYEFRKIYPVPNEIKADLREYQVLGFQWLKALNELGFGGCLADDMGLGKTLQVLSLLSDQKKQKKGTSLAIVPRSLLFNWAAEIDKFCPYLSYIHYHGPDRVLKRDQLCDFDLVITTYDTATNDVEFFKDIRFNYIILDESQAIKNPASKRYKAMRLLNAQNRIVMTGTPIENNTFDLYAQFSFINPGIFGSQQYFRERFALAIDKEQDADTAQLLKKMINPFLMRRTKEQVATDLPERVENVIYCEMDSVQRSFYDSLKNTIKAEIESAVFKKGFDKARFKIIEGLLRLRQVCNAPQLVDPSLPPHKRASVKIETLMDIIENDLGNHNALVFSQFTSMLDIVRAELDRKHIKYAYLDGSTKDRKAAVEYFEQNDDVRLFLLSLKAGNTGLNLVKADYVYLIDPWWNPAVEAQAIDRTHRIGQTKNVFAYKMICKNTIEEKIVELQSNKKKLASELVVTDENVFKSLDKDEIIALFN